MLMIMSLKGATSDYACVWYKIHKIQRWDMTKDLDFYNSGELKRTSQEIRYFHGSKKFCCIHPPLFNIELDHVVLDELYLMMRITDRLTENIITEVMERDSKADFLKERGEDKGIYFKRLISVINDLGITFLVWEKNNADGKGSCLYDWTSLMGSDKKKLLHLLPSQLKSRDILWPETKETVVKLWRGFESLYHLINADPEENENLVLDVSEKSEEFCSLGGTRVGYNKFQVTPYMHALSYHVPVLIKNHKASNSLARVLRKTVMMQKEFFFKSQLNGMQLRMHCSWRCNSKPSITVKGKRENTKNKTMNTGMVELLSHVKKECILGMVQVQVNLKVKHLL